jgi:FkbM family methyltransferase
MNVLTKIKNKIRDCLKIICISKEFDFINRAKLVCNTCFPRKVKCFFQFSTPEGIRIRHANEIPVYVDDFICGDILEPLYLDNLKSKEHPVIIDLGCNSGIVAEYLMRMCPGARYFAFDMMKECVEATRNRLSKFSGVSFYNFALGNENKTIELTFDSTTDSANSLCNNGGKNVRSVEMRRLDDAGIFKSIDTVDLLKIDVEGFEESVLAGALKTIQKSKFVVIELHLERHCNDYSYVSKILSQCGHVLYKVKARNLYFKKSV